KPAPTTTTNDKGQLEAALVSSKPVKEAKVFLQAGGMEKTQVGAVSFEDNPALFHIGEAVDVSPKVPSQVGDGTQTYTYTATVLGGDGKPVVNQKIANVKWIIDKDNKELIWNPPNGDVTTNEKGELTATLASHAEVKNITVSLSIENKPPVKAVEVVSFTWDLLAYRVFGGILEPVEPPYVYPPWTQIADGTKKFIVQGLIVDGHDLNKKVIVPNKDIPNLRWTLTHNDKDVSHDPNYSFDLKDGYRTDKDGKVTATLTSKVPVEKLEITLYSGAWYGISSNNMTFIAPDPKDDKLKVTIVGVNDNHPDTAERMKTVGDTFDYIATLEDAGGNKLKNKTIHWTVNKEASQNVIFKTPQITQTDENGEAYATITSAASTLTSPFVVVTASTDNNVNHSDDGSVMFKWPQFDKINIDPPSVEPLGGSYTLSSIVTRATISPPKGTPFGEDLKFKWRFKEPTFEKGLSLLPAGEMNVGAGGKLEVKLISDPSITPATDVIVCLYIVSIGPTSSDTCSKPINFKKP
ncbi:Ig-like domain-containing protein, partial [Xenorhabdus littoralis]|uniref:Ig-like domain-containing protein n=1 Tax=Xenorhabdus littoralis TaxID=2582835 RepID=UPI0029E8135B